MQGFRISKRESVKENISRILTGQVDYILGHCAGDRENIHISIHEIRKSIKRIRAVLRLIREEIGYSTYYRENVYYRDINRKLSDLRTANVLVFTLEYLKSEIRLRNNELDPLIRSILGERKTLLGELISVNGDLKDFSELFLKGRERIPELPIEHNGFEAFEGGIHRMYRQSRDYLDKALQDHGTDHLHDMRKRMKYLWYQIQILTPIYPVQLKAFARALEGITEKLGIYHDLEVLNGYIREPGVEMGPAVRQTLLDACEFKKAALLPWILRKSGPAFSEDPGALVHRMGEYWKQYYRQ